MNINFTTLFAQQCCVGICCCFDLCAFSWVKKGANSLSKKKKKKERTNSIACSLAKFTFPNKFYVRYNKFFLPP